MKTLEEKMAELKTQVLTDPKLEPKYKTNMYSFTYYGDYNECLHFSDSWRQKIDENQLEYFILGFENCPTTNTHHGQGFLIFKEPVSFFVAKRLLKPAHVEISVDSATKNISYCQKSGKFVTFADKKYFYAATLDNLKKAIYTEG